MIEIVRMNESHVAAVAELEKQNFSAPWDEASVRSELTNKLALWLVALEGENVVGYVGSQTVLQEADMMNVAAVAELERLNFSTPWDEASVRSELTNKLALWLVALEGEKVVGYVGSQTVLQEADMMNVAVADSHRRRGIARALVEELIRQLDAYQLTLEVRQSNLPAISLYESMGFQQVGLRKNYYQKPKENALILRKEWEI